MTKKRIGLDMRMAGAGFGIGRYATELAWALLKRQNSKFDYVLFFDREFGKAAYDFFQKIHSECRLLSAKYYSMEEQTKLPIMLVKENLDLAHFPNFNVPVCYPGKFVVTIHDLIHHIHPGRKRKNFIHRLGYKMIINIAVRRAKKVIAVSRGTKSDIIRMLGAPEEKISVIYEGVAESFHPRNPDPAMLAKFGISLPFILAVGVWRRYKNLPFLSAAFAKLKNKYKIKEQLVIVGDEDKNYPDIRNQIFGSAESYKNEIIAIGRVADDDLAKLYSTASCYVNPSLSEGFGLTALEAQACGCPAICADIPVLKEVLKDSAVYFDPHSPDDIAEVVRRVLISPDLQNQLKKRGLKNSENFRWERCAKATEELYESLLFQSI